MLLNHPTKISNIAFYKPGNNRGDIVRFVGADIFTNKKYEQTLSSSDYVMVPKVQKYELEVVDINNNDFVSLILPNGNLKQDVKLP